jgi:CAAX amino terminal protease family.
MKILIVAGVFLLCVLLIILTLQIVVTFFTEDNYQLTTQIHLMKITQIIQSLLIFIVPAFFLAYLVSTRPLKFLGISGPVNYKAIIASVIAVVASLPVLNIIITWNYYITPPDFLKDFWEWSKEQEFNSMEATQNLLYYTNIGGWLFNFFLVGILAAFSEEVFFRGLLLSSFSKLTKSKSLSIWVIAILFSAIHLQFLGFFPRMLLGVLFGYMFVWTGSIWPAIIAHLTNNTIALIQFSLYGNEALLPPDKATQYTATNFLLAIGGAIVLVACCLYIYKYGKAENIKSEKEPDIITD